MSKVFGLDFLPEMSAEEQERILLRFIRPEYASAEGIKIFTLESLKSVMARSGTKPEELSAALRKYFHETQKGYVENILTGKEPVTRRFLSRVGASLDFCVDRDILPLREDVSDSDYLDACKYLTGAKVSEDAVGISGARLFVYTRLMKTFFPAGRKVAT